MQELPDVSGTGWLYTQSDIDALTLDQDGLIDDDLFPLFDAAYKRWNQYQPNRTSVIDVNNNGDIIIAMIGSVGYSAICGKQLSNCINANGPEGLRNFVGINDNRDAVGYVGTSPKVWLRDGTELVVNDLNLLVAGSGYTVTAVGDINNSRQIAASCKKSTGEVRGCVINL